jgi:hypothetical protein
LLLFKYPDLYIFGTGFSLPRNCSKATFSRVNSTFEGGHDCKNESRAFKDELP